MHRGPVVALAGGAALLQSSPGLRHWGVNLARLAGGWCRGAIRGWRENKEPKQIEEENAYEKEWYCPTVSEKECESVYLNVSSDGKCWTESWITTGVIAATAWICGWCCRGCGFGAASSGRRGRRVKLDPSSSRV